MAGVKGSGGPVPKRSDQRRRRNAPARPVKKAASGTSTTKSGRPTCNTKWHPVARRWFLSLDDSGQSKFYEPSDWALAYLIAESMSRELKPQPILNPLTGEKIGEVERPPKGSSLAGWLKAMTSLLVTEGDRRRLGIELQQAASDSAEPAPAPVTSIASWKAGIGS